MCESWLRSVNQSSFIHISNLSSLLIRFSKMQPSIWSQGVQLQIGCCKLMCSQRKDAFLKFLLHKQHTLFIVHFLSYSSSIYQSRPSLRLCMTCASACLDQYYFMREIQQLTRVRHIKVKIIMKSGEWMANGFICYFSIVMLGLKSIGDRTKLNVTYKLLLNKKTQKYHLKVQHNTANNNKVMKFQQNFSQFISTEQDMFGQDQKGSFYPNIDEMWEVQMNNKRPTYKVVDPIGSIKNWYQRANQYWNKAESTYDGVLSGYGNLSEIDIQGSQQFINQLKTQLPQLSLGSVLDCGAGIGRISKELFVRYFENVDIIDQCEKYVNKAREILKGTTARHYYCSGLQDFTFPQKYDVIWIQWVLSHLTDEDAIEFFKRARNALNKNGVIVLKENHSEKGFLVDKEDFSVTRSQVMYRNLIQRAGLKIVKEQVQLNWPESLFNVKMYALV